VRPAKRYRLGLVAKLAICVVASTSIFFALFGFINLKMAREHSESLIEQAADRVTDVILRSTRYEMLHNDRAGLYNIVQELGSGQGIQRIRIFNKEGRITVSTEAGEIDTVVDKSAEACYGCHAQSAPLVKLQRPDRSRRFTDRQGHEVIGVIRPIDNAPDCAHAGCHQSPATQPVLGVIDANLSLATVNEQRAQQQASLAWFLAGAILLGSVLATAFIWIVIHRPVKELIDGTHRVADGDLSYRLPVGSDDELGELARSFNGMTAQLAGVQAEIEERVRHKTAELEKLHKTLLTSEKMASLGKLSATVAHEINNPLFGILTYARLVQRSLLKVEFAGRDEVSEQLQTIERECKRCGELVKNLLAFSRQQPGRREPHDLNAVVHRAVLLVKHKLDLQNIQLRETLPEDLPEVECNASQIEQVTIALLVNASEAMPKGGAVEVTTEFDPAAGQVVLRVKDTGHGIPPEVVPRIFDPFFTTKDDQHRTGLGLAVAAGIVEQHAGVITVQSKPGEGAEFTVALPATAGVPAGIEPRA
jgi:two-component system, NtrC family, sensor kinase